MRKPTLIRTKFQQVSESALTESQEETMRKLLGPKHTLDIPSVGGLFNKNSCTSALAIANIEIKYCTLYPLYFSRDCNVVPLYPLAEFVLLYPYTH